MKAINDNSMRCLILLLIFVGYFSELSSQSGGKYACIDEAIFWEPDSGGELFWNAGIDHRLPMQNHLEMSGYQMAADIRYQVDKKRNLHIERHFSFPYLDRNGWRDNQDGIQTTPDIPLIGDEVLPMIWLEDKSWHPGPLEEVRWNGTIIFKYAMENGLRLQRTFFPSTQKSIFIERWDIKNEELKDLELKFNPDTVLIYQNDSLENPILRITTDQPQRITLGAGQAYRFSIYYTPEADQYKHVSANEEQEWLARMSFLQDVGTNLVLVTPDPVLNQAFEMAKFRAAESIFETAEKPIAITDIANGLAGIHAQHAGTYLGPFFPFLGVDKGNEAIIEAYREFGNRMKPDYSPIPSFVPFTTGKWGRGAGSGGAASIAYGAAYLSITSGDSRVAENLWPIIEWCLEYCHQQSNGAGAILSQKKGTTEKEAYLNISCMAYAALGWAAILARELGKSEKTFKTYLDRAARLKTTINTYFGAEVDGFQTYQYARGDKNLNSWIGFPLTIGIEDRKTATLNALFDKLWHYNGLPISSEKERLSDAATLMAITGAFRAGEADRALLFLKTYTCRRLMGKEGPYPLSIGARGKSEQGPGESALYCRTFIEGLFGIKAKGLRSFSFQARLPLGWKTMELREIKAFGTTFGIKITRSRRYRGMVYVIVFRNAKVYYRSKRMNAGRTINITFRDEN